jgi:GIY-YIG catalytic domain
MHSSQFCSLLSWETVNGAYVRMFGDYNAAAIIRELIPAFKQSIEGKSCGWVRCSELARRLNISRDAMDTALITLERKDAVSTQWLLEIDELQYKLNLENLEALFDKTFPKEEFHQEPAKSSSKQTPVEERFLDIPNVGTLPFADFEHRRSQLPKLSGVYFCINQENEILYIGMSATSLRSRWKGHGKAKECENLGAHRIAYMLVADAEECLKTETGFIERFRPKLNRTWKPLKLATAY